MKSYRMYKLSKLQAVGEAMRAYFPPTTYTEADGVRLSKEVRAELAAERELQK